MLSIGATGCNIKTKDTQTDGGFFASTDFGENWKQKVFVSQEKSGVRTISSVGTEKMVFDPNDARILYLLTTGSGIYKTINKGEQWYATGLASGTYVDLSIDHRNSNVLYVTQGTKILKSVDAGKTWHDIYIETRAGQKLVAVAVTPEHPDTVYAASTSSMLKSTDYGNTWKLLEWKEPLIKKIFISEKNVNTLFALTTAGLFKSADAAATWTDITIALKQFKGARSIAWIDFNPTTERILLGTSYGILRSTDVGQNWTEIPTLFDFKKVTISTVIEHPDNPDRILFATKNIIQKTIDGGRTWKTLKTVPTGRTINFLINDPETPDSVYLGTKLPPQK